MAVEAYVYCRVNFPQARIIMAVDNSATFYCLKNGFTTSRMGAQILGDQEIRDVDDIFLVTSKCNPADCPSRENYDDFDERVQRLTDAWTAHTAGGRKCGTETPYEGEWAGTRHPEGDPDSIDERIDLTEVPESDEEEVML